MAHETGLPEAQALSVNFFAQPAVEGAPADAQYGSRPAFVAPHFIQHVLDITLFHLGKGRQALVLEQLLGNMRLTVL